MSKKSILAIFAHPDDETFRPGGTLSLLARRGVCVQVFTATRGGGGSCGNPPLCTQDELPDLRERELRCACAALGIESPILLDYQDGDLSEVVPETIVADILSVVNAVHPQIILTFGPDGISGHPDHVAVSRYTAEAFQRATDVTALYHLSVPQSLADALGMEQIHAVPDSAITHIVDISEVWDAKMTAIRCHCSQMDESPILQDEPEKQRLFLGAEHFCLSGSHFRTGNENVDLLKWLEN
jgi:LmbE family N-acetylglucosaminyl deacetylase